METGLSKDELTHVDYQVTQIIGFKWILLFILLLIIGFTINFPVKEKIETTLRTTLANNSKCPIFFDELKYNLIPPSIDLLEINVPSICSDKTLKDLQVPKLRAGLGGISFSPLGLVSNIDIHLLKSPISAKIILGIGKYAIKIDNNQVNLTELMGLLKKPYRVGGDAELYTKLIFDGQNISEGEIGLKSNNLILPSQNISSFETPNLDLKNLDLAIIIPEGSTDYLIQRFDIGSQDAPLRVRLNEPGIIKANPENFNKSRLDVKLELAPSRALLDQFLIIESLLSPYNLKDGFYRIKLGGEVGKPKPTSY